MSCSDMVIVFCGIKDAELEKQIELADGKVTENVKQATHILVKKRGDKITKKQQEAEEKGLTVLDYETFIEEHDFTKKPKVVRKTNGAKKSAKNEEEEPNHKPDVMNMLNKIIHTMATGEDKDDAILAIDEIKNMMIN